MNRTVKRYLMGLIASATMFGTARAQDDGPVGAVQLGTQAQVPVQSPAVAPQATDVPSNVPFPPGAQGLPTAPMPPMAGMSQVPQPGSPGYGNYFRVTPVDTVIQPRFIVNSYGGGLYGYQAGYANIGAFIPYKIDDTAILFATGMGMATYDGKGGGTIGAGWRYYMEDLDRILGLSVFGDFDNGHNQPYQQVGFSFESLGRYIDYRVNGYVPVSNANHVLNTNQTTNAALVGNGIGLLRYQTIEQSYSGFDAELGGPTPILGRYGLNAYIGGYSFSGNGTQGGNFQGVSGRLLAQINEDVSFGVQVTDDHVFGLNTQFQVFATLPGGRPSRWMRNLRVQDRMVQNVFRQNRVIANTGTDATYVTAINPSTNKPYFVANINPNLNSTVIGNGSVTNPFSSIAQYESQTVAQQQQYSMIYVQPRTDGTHTNLDTATTLDIYNGQRLLSTSVAQTFVTSNLPGTTFNMPGFTGGSLPVIYNSSGGNVVTLIGGNTLGEQVSGFNIVGSLTGNGIYGNNNVAVNISNNTIQQGLNGVLLTNLTGTIASDLSATVATNSSGIVATNLSGSAATNLSGTINSGTNPQLNGTTLSTGVSATSLTGGVNLISLNGVIQRVSTGTEAQIFNNTFRNNYGNGIQITNKNQPPLEVVVQGNTFSANGNVTLPSGTVLTTLQLSQIANLGGTVTPQTNGTTIVTVPTSDGMRIDALSGSSIAGIIGGSNNAATSTTGAFNQVNVFAGNSGNGLDLQANGGTLNFMNSTQPTLTPFGIIGNTFTSNGSGITAAQTSSLITAQLNNTFGNPFAGNGFDGLHINTTNNSIANFNVISNTFGSATNPNLGNKEYGVGVSSDSGNTQINIGGTTISSTGTVLNLGNNFYSNDVSAINLAATGTAALAYNISNNTITNGVTSTTPAPQDSFTFTFNGTSGAAPFIITNTSPTAGVDITSVVWNLAGTAATIAPTGLGNRVVLQPINDTLLTSLNGIPVFTGSNPLTFSGTNTLANNANSGLAAGSQLIPMGFTNFAPTNVFRATALLEQNGGSAALTSAATNGSSVTVTFSNGQTATELVSLQPSVSALAVGAAGTVFGASTPGYGTGGDGIHVSATGNATLNSLTYDAFTFNFNGTSGTTAFSVTNNSESGVSITNLDWNLNPSTAVIGSNTTTAVVQPVGNTLLTKLNGNNVVSANTPLLMGSPSPNSGLVANNTNAGIPAGSQLLGLGFLNPTTNTSSFNSGTTFNATSLLNARGSSSPLSSLGTVGSTITVRFSDGVVETANVLPFINFQQASSSPTAVTAVASAFNVAPATSNDPTIFNNSVSGYGGYGIHVQTAMNATESNVIIQNNNLTSNGTGINGAGAATFTGGGLELDRHDSSLLNAVVANNTISSNFNYGMTILTDGTAAGGMIINSHDNTGSSNASSGLNVSSAGAALLSFTSSRDTFNGNGSGSSKNPSLTGGDNISLTTSGTSVATININNVSANNSSSNGLTSLGAITGNGLSATTNNSSTLNLVIDSPSDSLYTGTGSSFSNNLLNGILFSSNDTSYMHANVFNTTVQSNTSNGIAYNRSGASLVQSNVVNSTITSNKGSGIFYNGIGSDSTDATQPMSGTPNLLNLVSDQLNTNGVDGATIHVYGQSDLLMNALSTSFNNNIANGIHVDLTPGAGFGNVATNQASNFDNVDVLNNGTNGIFLSSQESAAPVADAASRVLFNLNSAHGDTIISNNGTVAGSTGGDGILMQFQSGIQNVTVQGGAILSSTPIVNQYVNGVVQPVQMTGAAIPLYQTVIQANGVSTKGANGVAGQGDGIHADIGNFANTTLNVTTALIGGSNTGLGNQGDGIGFDVVMFTVPPVQINNGNGTSAAYITSYEHAGVGTLNVNTSLIENNLGNGITLYGNGLTGTGFGAANYATRSGNGLSDGFGQINANITNNMIVNNIGSGVSIDILGRMGGDKWGFYSTAAPGFDTLTFTNNIISNNGNFGVYFESNAGIQGNFAYLFENFNPLKLNNYVLQPTNLSPAYGYNYTTGVGVGTNQIDGVLDAGFLSNWLLLPTTTNSQLVMTNNTIQGNGQNHNLGTADALKLRISTDSYASVDLQSNNLTGNVGSSLRVESFVQFNPTNGAVQVIPASTVNGPPTLSVAWLDPSAQLDLRMVGNTGNTVNIVNPLTNQFGTLLGNTTPNGAVFPWDPAKDPFATNDPFKPVRLTQLFQLDNGTGVNNLNLFVSNGVTQDLLNSFYQGDFWNRAAADPLFPNPLFPQDSTTSPGNPFLP